MKKITIIILILIVLSVTISVTKDMLIKASIESIVSLATGLKADIGRLKTSIPKTFIGINDTLVFNPRDFKDRVLLDMPEIYIDFDLSAFLGKKIHLYDMRINIKELTIVKIKDGRTNLDSIKSLKQKEEVKQAPGAKPPDLKIDNLILKIGTVTYKDYSSGEAVPKISRFNINIDATYKNVKGTNAIVQIIIAKALINTTIGNLSDFGKFKNSTSDALKGTKDVLEKKVGELKEGLKNILESPF